MSHPEPDQIESEDVEYYRADDGRTVAIHMRASFEDYEAYPPYLETEEEKRHLEEAYDARSPEFERKTKAHVTPDEFPIQVIVLNRPPGSAVNPHYHEVTEHPPSETRHQIMYCQRGALEIGVYTKEGDHLETARVEAGDIEGDRTVAAVERDGATVLVAIGSGAITGTQDELGSNNAENALTQLDSQAALVALDNSDRQQVDLGAASAADYRVDGDAGTMRLTFDSGGTTTELFETSMGAVRYDGGSGSEIVYQGGGVWRTNQEGGSVMVSPPEFHYRDETLTMPLVITRGNQTMSNRASISHFNTTQYYPNESIDSSYVNPLETRNLRVTVQSSAYQAWGSYFEERTQGTVTYDHPNNEVTIQLIPPFDETFENAVATTAEGGITVKPPKNDNPSPYDEGVNYPSPDDDIEDQITECNTVSGACDESTDWDSIGSAGTYYHGSGNDFTDSVEIDSPGENVTLVVDGQFDPSDVEIENVDEDHAVTVMVRQDYDISPSGVRLNDVDGEPEEYKVVVHSDGEVNLNGDSGMVGLIYAPGSHCDLNGGGSVDPNIEGGAVCETMRINGDPNEFQYDSAIEDADIAISDPQAPRLQYLHVSTNVVNVTSG
jgi:hypothetical protein